MRIARIGNCQVQTIACIIGRALPESDVSILDFSDSTTASSAARIRYAEDLSGVNLILTHWTKISHLETEALQSRRGEKVIRLGNFFFGGLHPDVCYLEQKGEHGAKLAGYHSWTILASFMRGLSREQAAANFNADWFRVGCRDP